MFRSLLASLCAALALFVASPPSIVNATDKQASVLTVAEDGSPEAINGSSPAAIGFVDSLTTLLRQMNFTSADLPAAGATIRPSTMGGYSDEQLIELARTAPSPVDVVVTYTLRASVQNAGYANRMTMQVTGRVFDLRAGADLGKYDISPGITQSVPANCDRACFDAQATEFAKLLSEQLAVDVAARLEDAELTSELAATVSAPPGLLLIGEDIDPAALERGSRPFRQLVSSLHEGLVAAGFVLADEASATLDSPARPGVSRSKSELLDIARGIAVPPVAAVVTFAAYVDIKTAETSRSARLRVTGRLLDVKTGQDQGTFEFVTPNEWVAPPGCTDVCAVDSLGDFMVGAAPELTVALAQKLSWLAVADGDASAKKKPASSDW